LNNAAATIAGAGDAAKSKRYVAVSDAWRTPQFWLLWLVLCLNVSAGIGVLGMASPLLQEIFGGRLIGSSLEFDQLSAEQLKQVGVKRISIVTVEDDWPVAVSDDLSSKAAQHGLSVVGEWRVLPTELDFRTIAGRLKGESADAIFLNVGIAQIGPFVKQVRDLGVTTQIYSNFWAAKAEVRAAGGDRLRGVRYVEMRTDSPALPANASGATLSAYVATHLILQARSKVEGALTRESLFGALSAQREVRTEAGIFPVRDRKIQFPLFVREIK
jgi:ABC-type branched-subunit amino acid transport system substrate-binding protein